MTDPDLKVQIRNARGKFAAMASTYCLGVFNDNFFKQAVSLMAVYAGHGHWQGRILIVFTVPWLLCSAYAGWLADRFPKRRIVIGAKVMELTAMLCGAAGILLESWPLIFVMVFLMSLQSTIFSPSLNGSIPELYPAGYVLKANSLLKMLTTSGILLGTIFAGVILKYKGLIWGYECGRVLLAVSVVAIAAIGLIVSFGVPHRRAAAPHVGFPWAGPVDTIRELWKFRHDRLLAIIVTGDAFIWFLGALQLMVINQLGKDMFGLNEQQTSLLLAPELVGLAIGGLLAGRLASDSRWIRVLGPAMVLMGAFSWLMLALPLLPAGADVAVFGLNVPLQIFWSGGAFFLMGLAGGFLLVPMEAFFQVRPGPEEKGAVIAAANFAGFFGIAIAGIINMTLNKYLSPTDWFGAIGVVAIVMGAWLWSALRKEAANA